MNGQGIASLAALFILIPIEQLFPASRGKKLFRNGWSADVCHFLLNHLIVKAGLFLVLVTTLYFLKGLIPEGVAERVRLQPRLLQFVEALIIADATHYFAHRLCHRIPFLWRFHAVHHSSEQLDALAAGRLHPFDQIFTKACTIIPLVLLGFTAEVFGSYLVVAAAQAIFLHANVRITFGPLRYLIATPEFHHWHHASEPEAINKNFAGQFPWIDALLGSLHLPRRWPERYGIRDALPDSYVGQLLHPLRPRKRRPRRTDRPSE